MKHTIWFLFLILMISCKKERPHKSFFQGQAFGTTFSIQVYSINEIEFELSRKRMLVIITMMSSLFYFSVLFNRELCSQTQEEINRWRASEHLQGLNVYS